MHRQSRKLSTCPCVTDHFPNSAAIAACTLVIWGYSTAAVSPSLSWWGLPGVATRAEGSCRGWSVGGSLLVCGVPERPGGAMENRTPDLFHAMEALYQLSYSPERKRSFYQPRRAGLTPLESLAVLAPTLTGRIHQAAAQAGAGVTFVSGEVGIRVTWSDLHTDACRAAATLQRRGIGPGSHVAILGPTTRSLVTAIEAVWLAGATPRWCCRCRCGWPRSRSSSNRPGAASNTPT